MDGEQRPRVYAVRVSTRAFREINEAMLYLAELTGEESVALRWREGCFAAMQKLASFPQSHPVSPEMSRVGTDDVRRMLYRLTPSGTAYHLYYLIREGDDSPTVRVVHVRHAARRPLTRAEARTIIASEAE